MAEFKSLGDFFGAIANAIREKKGTTDKIVPINFPQEIASIGSGGSGGSDDPYYKVACPCPYVTSASNSESNTHFTFKGENYFFVRGTTSGKIYKYENDTYTEVATTPQDFTTNLGWGCHKAFEYDNHVYLIYDTNKVSRWDGGTTFEVLTTVDTSTGEKYSNYHVLYNNSLYAICIGADSTGIIKNVVKLYKYNKDSDTYTLEKSISINNAASCGDPFVYNGELYINAYISGKSYLYRYDGNAFVKVRDDALHTNFNGRVIINDKAYYYVSNSSVNGTLRRYDMTTGEDVELMRLPYFLQTMFVFDGVLHLKGGSPEFQFHYTAHGI